MATATATATTTTHPAQVAAIFAWLIGDVVGLAALNRLKASGRHRCHWSWPQRRLAYWLLIAATVLVEVLLDTQFAISSTALPIKA